VSTGQRHRASLLAAGGLLAACAVFPATAASAAAAAVPSALVVVITGLSPVSPTPQSTLVVAGTVANHTSDPVSEVSATLDLGYAIGPDRQALDSDEQTPPVDVNPIATVHLPERIGAGGSVAFRVSLPLDDVLGLSPTSVGVYPLQVHVSVDGLAAGQADTFLPWLGYQPSGRLRVVTVWPIDDAPALSESGALTSGTLAGEISPSGRLGELVADTRTAAQGGPPPTGRPRPRPAKVVPLTWLVEPSLVQAVQRMTTPYPQVGLAGMHRADPAARTFLDDLQAASGPGELVALPYGDPDQVALQRAGLTSDLTTSYRLGTSTVSDVLHVAAAANVAWPAGGLMDQVTITTLSGAGVSQVLLSDTELAADPNADPATPSAVTELPTGIPGVSVEGLATDSTIGALLAAGGRDAPSPRMAEQLVLAQTALIVLTEKPNDPQERDLVLAPPRYWNPERSYATGLLRELAEASWISPVTLAQTQGDPAGQRSGTLVDPEQAERGGLPMSTLAAGRSPNRVGSLRATLTSLSNMLGPGFPTVLGGAEAALYRAESVAWRTDPAGGAALRRGVAAQIQTIMNGVKVVSAPRVTLTAHHTHLPVTVANNLPYRVQVVLHVISPDPSRLRTTASQPVVLGPGEKRTLDLVAYTQESGRFSVDLQLTTPDGRALGPALELIVNSTAYGAITIAITLAALAVLGLAIVVRLGRRLRARRSTGPTPAERRASDAVSGRQG
jgi:hypothetical protein